MRSVVFWYPDLGRMEQALVSAQQTQQLPLPAGIVVVDGEWVLATFEVAEANRSTAAAGRATTSSGRFAVTFEPRDWERLRVFCSRVPEVQVAQAPGPVVATLGRAPEPEEEAPRTVHCPPPEFRAPTASLGARVLIVEDDEPTRDMVTVMLESVGLEVASTNTAEAGVELLLRDEFEILVLDWTLPGMSGLDLCRLVRRGGRNAALPILFLTGNTSPQDMLEAFASGADDYVTKPFRAAELGARIFALLRRARMAPVASS